MATQYCGECDFTYTGTDSDCPMCPEWRMLAAHRAAVAEVERYRFVKDPNTNRAVREMNELASEGWRLVSFTAAYDQNVLDGGGNSAALALFERQDYNRASHLNALALLNMHEDRCQKVELANRDSVLEENEENRRLNAV